jgi:bacteriocin biosynthesis cyclodehydratase domain-containing protein
MTDEDAAAVVAVGLPDVELRTLGDHRFELATPTRRFVLTADDRQWESLERAVTTIVPKLRRSLPLREQLGPAEVESLRPHLAQLTSMGVLIRPREPIGTAAEHRLYAYLSRRTTGPDDVYATLRRTPVQVGGDAATAEAIRQVLTGQGLTVAPSGRGGLTVLVVRGDSDALADANRAACDTGDAFLPVLLMPRLARIGPWTRPGESACLACLPGTGDRAAGARAENWATTQPGFRAWLAGLIGHLTLRALVPAGTAHPWGTVTSLDPETGEQETNRAWRDPYCPVCAPRRPAAQEWIEQ